MLGASALVPTMAPAAEPRTVAVEELSLVEENASAAAMAVALQDHRDLLDRDLLHRDLLDRDRLDRDLLDRDLFDRDRLDRDLSDRDRLDRDLLDRDLLARELSDRDRLDRDLLNLARTPSPLRPPSPSVARTPAPFP
ncbi:hypothetical protein [Polyangium aurulentum]|uniref:hypothetical protein n=1 Tax=Polyangium aurulentum TaxID=2567896 RepID=UPI00200E8D60|nr:hypothetical protein [Polyangium aurulentum]UQA62020.1 hypothetical protein E8A73_016710 [Polyangium aurulentum]